MNMAAAAAAAATIPTARTVKLFQSAQEYYHDIGIYPSRLHPDQHFNWKNVLILCGCVTSCISIFSYFLFEAKSMNELAQTFY